MIDPVPNDTEDRRQRLLPWLLVAVLLGVHWSIAMASSTHKSAAFDELAHVTGGVSYWQENDYRLLPAGGVLPQRVAGLPNYLRGVTFPSREQLAWHESRHWVLGQEFFFRSGNDPRALLWYGRMMIAFASVGLGWLVFVWSRQLFGSRGGFLSLLLYAFSPSVLAHGRFVTSDLFAALGFLFSCWALWRMLNRITLGTIVTSSVAMGVALTAKPSGVLMVPIAVLLAILRIAVPAELLVGRVYFAGSRWRRVPWILIAALVHVLLVVTIVWALYGFRFAAMREAQPGVDRMRTPWQEDLRFVGAARPFLASAHYHRLLPEGYLYGVAFTLSRSDQREAFLWGDHSMTGWWYFFPLAFLVKSPLALLLLVVLGLFAALLSWRHEQGGWRAMAYATAPLLLFLSVYGLTSITSNLNIGYRHVLPMLPALFVLLGCLGRWLARAARWLTFVVWGLVALHAAESLSVYPNFLSHFHRLVGGPDQGYRMLVDSSLDWGQDLPAVAHYFAADVSYDGPKYLAYFGTSDPGFYAKDVQVLPSYPFHPFRTTPLELRGGVYCVSASLLQAVHIRGAYGRWSPRLETEFQVARRATEQYLRDYPTTAGRERFVTTPAAQRTIPMVRKFERMQLARLCAALRQREPDGYAGPSILVFRLSDAVVQRAIAGPPEPLYGK